MTAKELERLIAERGGNPSALDTVTRKLREATRVSTGGRGFNAPALPASEAAWILMGYAGSDVAARAVHTMLYFSDFWRAEPVRAGAAFFSNSFNAAFQELLEIPELVDCVAAVTFAHNIGLATIVLKDGQQIAYCHEDKDLADVERQAAASFISQGVLSHGLLKEIAARLTPTERTAGKRMPE